MLPDSDVLLGDQSADRRFNSFAILDLETADFPSRKYNKVGITELSVYGIPREELEKERSEDGEIPELPRVLHKLTLMINPRMSINIDAERITGLNNFMLEYESPFNENAVITLLSFLKHLRQPVCLVAHNGYGFDFPIVKSVLEKVQMVMPETVYCVDSLRAFHDIDVEAKLLNTACVNISEERDTSDSCEIELVLEAEKNFDARVKNETTPKRPTTNPPTAAIKRKRNSNTDKSDKYSDEECKGLKNEFPKSKRCLNFGASISTAPINYSKENISYLLPPGQRWFPPKNLYKLGNLYKRTFKQDPKNTHYAEADVMILTQLMLHYGNDFIDYANHHAVSFQSIPAIGKK